MNWTCGVVLENGEGGPSGHQDLDLSPILLLCYDMVANK